jgi:hypothetical protein
LLIELGCLLIRNERVEECDSFAPSTVSQSTKGARYA